MKKSVTFVIPTPHDINILGGYYKVEHKTWDNEYERQVEHENNEKNCANDNFIFYVCWTSGLDNWLSLMSTFDSDVGDWCQPLEIDFNLWRIPIAKSGTTKV